MSMRLTMNALLKLFREAILDETPPATAKYWTKTHVREAIAAIAGGGEGGEGVSDHGELDGLADDDHTQYLNNTRGDARYSVLAHDHDGDYATAAHNHDADYADIAHDHDADYAAVSHTHSTLLTQAQVLARGLGA